MYAHANEKMTKPSLERSRPLITTSTRALVALMNARALMKIRDRLTSARERLALERSRALMEIWGRLTSARERARRQFKNRKK